MTKPLSDILSGLPFDRQADIMSTALVVANEMDRSYAKKLAKSIIEHLESGAAEANT